MVLHVQRKGPSPVPPDATQHMVPMRDGVNLATDVYLPEGQQAPGATVLTRLPYDKGDDYAFMPIVARYFTARGYRVVVQDVRGKFRSEGETLLFVNEAHDGHDTIDWIVDQPWSDGVVGMWGDSYYGYTQWAAASTAHPALRAMVPRVTGTRLGELPVPIPGQRQHDVEMSVHRFYPLTIFHERDTLEWDLDWSRHPLADAVEEFFDHMGSRSPSYDAWFPDPTLLDRFPEGSPFDAPAVPVLMTIGMWDNCAPWQWSDHEELQRRPDWARCEYLLIEAIDHENHSHFELDDPKHASASPEALARYLDPAVEFFDVFLRGADTSIPRVRWHLANSGDPTVRADDNWPPTGTVEVALYLAGAAASAASAPGGSLAEERGEPESATWVHDPAACVPSPVENPFAFLAEYPDERALADRADVLCFSGGLLDEPLDLVGPVRLAAEVMSDGPEMDVFVRLLDVDSSGAAHLVARGEQTVLTADGAHRAVIDLGHLGYRVPAGHSLRLTVASSDFPEFVPAPGTGEHRWLASRTRHNRQSLALGGADGAMLSLSVLPPAR